MPMTTISRRSVFLGLLPAACGLSGGPSTVPTLETLRNLGRETGRDRQIVTVTDPQRGGRFLWDGKSTLRPDDGIVIAPRVGGPGRWVRQYDGAIDAVWFGASPQASASENVKALRAASHALRDRGGTLIVRPGKYLVGTQKLVRAKGRGSSYQTQPIIEVDGASRPIRIIGRGATLKCAPGLRYGQFDPLTGRATEHALTDPDFRALPYSYMIDVRNCSGPILIEGFELDGSLEAHVLGGPWGDRGRQIQATGLYSYRNRGGVEIIDVWTHHHALDGVTVEDGALTEDSPAYPINLTNVRSEYNGRQGLSWVGGTQLTAVGCRFNHTGRAGFSTSPAAGVDMEAERSVCRNGRFVDCQFINNTGAGFLGESGDGADAQFERCTFVGTTYYALWPKLPGLKFRDCVIAGTLVNAYPSKDARRATQFYGCRFTTDTSLSPTGKLYNGTLVDIGGGSTNVLFDDCMFDASLPNATLPWSLSDTRYNNCTFSQAGPRPSYTRGVFMGTNRITSAGQVHMEGSTFRGVVYLNGRRLRG